MCLYNGNLHDYEFWSYMQNIKGRAIAIFCCCHAGTMFRSSNTIDNKNTTSYYTPNWNSSAYNFFKLHQYN
jgi:hypothetical protein